MPNNYNSIARYYDFISRLVFRRCLVEVQVALLKFIPANSDVLIAGGGTGWVLEEIAKIHPRGLTIYYVEISSEMIALAKKRNCLQNEVHFIHQPIENYIPDRQFDVVFTAFLFDNFLPGKIQTVFKQLDSTIKNEGTWLFADFVYDKTKEPLWQKFLLKTMYFFFRVTCNIEAQELINMEPFFEMDYFKIFEGSCYSNFVKSIIYKKRGVR